MEILVLQHKKPIQSTSWVAWNQTLPQSLRKGLADALILALWDSKTASPDMVYLDSDLENWDNKWELL